MNVTISPTTESGRITRDHLTPAEVARSIDAVRKRGGWYASRDATLIPIVYRHGLRRTEAAHLRWSDVDLLEGPIYIRRVKGSRSGRHHLAGDETRVLKRLKKENEPSSFVFTGNRRIPLSERTIGHIVHQAGILAGFEFPFTLTYFVTLAGIIWRIKE